MLVLPSRRLVRPAADDDFVGELDICIFSVIAKYAPFKRCRFYFKFFPI